MACQVIRTLAHGLSHLHHSLGIIHGDIKPANLILTNQARALKLIDLGSGWSADRTTSRLPGDGHSPVYAAPELQQSAGDINYRSDQFSLAVVWYELLTLKVPYDGLGGQAGLPELCEAFMGKLISPSTTFSRRPPIPAAASRLIDQVIRRSLAWKPDERYQSPPEWLNQLDQLRDALQPKNRASGIWKWLGR
jgi:serine/threonine protein kinase